MRAVRLLLTVLAIMASTGAGAETCKELLNKRYIINGLHEPLLSFGFLSDDAVVYSFPEVGVHVVELEGVDIIELQNALNITAESPDGVTINRDQLVRWRPSHFEVADRRKAGAGEEPASRKYDGEGVKIGLVDTPVAAHQKLPKIDSSCDLFLPPSKGLEHGTHIAGIIAAEAGTGPDGVGVAPGADLIVAPYRDAKCDLLSDAIAAIKCVVGKGAQVVNLSWEVDGPEPGLETVIRSANDSALFVAAAGDDGSDVAGYPAGYDLPNLISVGTIVFDGELSNDSDCDPDWIDIAAPGIQIVSTIGCCDVGRMDGSSHAAGFVSGAAALVMSARPGLGPAQTKTLLMDTASTNPSLSECVASGQLNIEKALLEATKVVTIAPKS